MDHKKEIAIVYIITKLELGGAQKVCLHLFNNMDQSPYFDTILISGRNGKLVPNVEHNPRAFLLESLEREASGSTLWKEVKAFFALIKTLRTIKRQYKQVIVHTHSTKAGIYGRWAAWFARIKKRIHTVHGYGFHAYQPWATWLAIYSLEWLTSLITTHFVCVSSRDIETGIQSFPWFANNYSLIRAGVDEQLFIPAQKTTLGDSRNPFVFGTVACFKPQKNIIDLLKAFSLVHMHNPQTRLEIIGDGILRPDIERWIREHKLSKAITLHGWQDDVSSYMQRWHTFVLSSLWEGLPCAVIEARLHRLPVICYNTGGIKDVIFHELNGLLCQQQDWLQLSEYMKEIITNQLFYNRFRSFRDNLKLFANSTMLIEHHKLYTTFIR